MKPGDTITLFNGDGSEYPARLETVHKQQVEASILHGSPISRERTRRLTIACPLPKGDRGQFLVEKLTELGVYRYIPLKTRRSIVHPGEGKLEKLQRYVIEASKQCGRNILMLIEPLQYWEELVTMPCPTKWLADREGTSFPREPAHAEPSHGEPTRSEPGRDDIIIALGPEGGWTDEERHEARSARWQLVSLSPATLRLETAALAAATLALTW